MSSPYQVLIRTPQASARVQADLRQALPSGAKVDVYRVDAEEARDVQQHHRFSPNLTADVRPARPGEEGAAFVALVSWAASNGADLLVLLDYERMMAFERGTLSPVSSERAFFEQHVLPGWAGPVSWTARDP